MNSPNQNLHCVKAILHRRLLPLCFLAFIGLLLSSCASAPKSGAVYPPHTPYPTYTVAPTATSVPMVTAPSIRDLTPTQPITYVVQSGDTLGRIANRFGTTIDQLAEVNRITDVSLIELGQVLTLPQAVDIATPGPMATSIPTSTSLPDPSSAVQSYLFQIADQSRLIGDALKEIRTLTEQARFGDADWTVLLAIQFARIRNADKKLRGLEPPPEMFYIHIALLSATANFVTATEHMTLGIDEFNPDEIVKATEFMQRGNEMLDFATELVEEYTASLE